MKILLTGSHGFIGTHFRKKSGFKNIVCIDRKIGKKVEAIKLKDLKNIKVIVHLAASISGRESWEKPEEYIRNNTINTIRLFRLAQKAHVPLFIFASSAAVYGGQLTPYGLSKAAADHYLEAYREDELTPWIVTLRFFNVYGKGQNPEYAGVITKFWQAIKKNKKMQLFNSGKSTRDFVYVDDIVKALVKVINEPMYFNDRAMDVATGKSISIKKLGELMEKIVGRKVGFENAGELDEITNSKGENEAEFDWKFTKLEDGLRKMIE